jgi:hypothetical protein
MCLRLYDEVTNVLRVSHLSHDRYQYDSLILSKQTWAYPVNTCNGCCDVKGAEVVLTSRKNAWKQIFIFPLRCYANCVSTKLAVLITLKVPISFTVTLYYHRRLLRNQWLMRNQVITAFLFLHLKRITSPTDNELRWMFCSGYWNRGGGDFQVNLK